MSNLTVHSYRFHMPVRFKKIPKHISRLTVIYIYLKKRETAGKIIKYQ